MQQAVGWQKGESVNSLYKALLVVLAFGGACSLALPAAAETIAVAALTPDGATLGTKTASSDIDDLRFSVDLAGDTPEASYVWAIVGGARILQRTNDGYWVSWNGDTAQLIDNKFGAVDGRLVFKIMDQTIGADNQGITLGIGYRAGGVLKFGIYGILPQSSGS